MQRYEITMKEGEKDINGRVIGISFKYPEDATTFKLVCRIV